MASRVNKPFVIGLTAGIIVLLGAALTIGYFAVRKTKEDLVRLGDQKYAEGKYDEAVAFYSKAVAKDQRNGPWISKWIVAMEKTTPENERAYADAYWGQYHLALKAIPDADRSDINGFRRILEEDYQWIKHGNNGLGALEDYVKNVDGLMKTYAGKPENAGVMRRYRGLVRAQIIAGNPDAKPEDVDSAIADLDAGLAAEPNDAQATLTASLLEQRQAELARQRDDAATKDKMLKASRARLEKFAKAYPPASAAQFQMYVQDVGDAMRAYAESSAPNKSANPGPEILKAHEAQLKAIVDGLKSVKPEEMDIESTMNIAGMAATTMSDGLETAKALYAQLLKGHPKEQAVILLGEAHLLLGRGKYDEAQQVYKQVVALPNMPMCMQGLLLPRYRAGAIGGESDIVFDEWRSEKDQAKRADLIKQFKDLRKELADRVGDGDNRVMAQDARLAFMSGDMAGARTLITRYNDLTDRKDIPMLVLEGQILNGGGDTGAAQDVFKRVLSLQPQNPQALSMLGSIAMQNQNYAEAVRYFGMLAALNPGNKALEENLRVAREMATGSKEDPVVAAIQEAQERLSGPAGDLDGAIEILKKARVERPTEVRLGMALAQVYVYKKDRASAQKVIDELIAANPDDKRLKQISEALANKDLLQSQLTTIEASTQLTPVQKSIARYQAYMQAEKPEQARKELAEAVKLAPDNPTVVEMQFTDAIARNDLKEQEKLATYAEQHNTDKVGGALFRARVQIAEKQYDDAIHSLRDVTDKDKFNLLAWRLLGMTLSQTKQYAAAVDALGKAVEINPHDLPATKAYIMTLMQVNRLDDALRVARRVENRAGNDKQFREILLTLESEALSGDKDRAIKIRKEIAERSPDDKQNKAQLASLLINEKRYDEAQKIVDEFRKDPLDATGVELEAGLLGKKGDIQGASKVYSDFLDALPADKKKPALFIEAASLLKQLGSIDLAVAVLKKGQSYQDPKLLEIDRELGDIYFESRAYDKAIEVYKHVLASGTEDKDQKVSKRILEGELRQKKYAELDADLAKLGDKVKSDSTLLLLAAESAAQQNDRPRARKLYDQAVSADPKNPLVYLKRGDFNRADLSLVRDVEQDYEQAIQLNPRANIARVRLGLLYNETGRTDQAIDQFKRAADADPFDDTVRSALLDLLIQHGRSEDAVAEVQKIVKMQPDNPQWLARGATLMSRLGRHDLASDYLSQVWKSNKTPDVGMVYSQELLSKNPPDFATVNDVLLTPSVRADKSMALKLLRARWYRLQKKNKEATNEVLDALAMVDPNKRQDGFMFVANLEQIYPKSDELQTALARLSQDKPFTGWLAYSTAIVRLRDTAKQDAVVADLRALIKNTTDPVLLGQIYGTIGDVAYESKRWDEARQDYEAGIQADPTNAQLKNNIAYVLAMHLNQVEEGLKYAQLAVKADPNSSWYVDTLGCIHMALKNYDKAAQTLVQAMSLAATDVQRGPVFVHLAQARLGQGQKSEARRLLALAEQALSDNQRLTYDSELKGLHKALDQD